jgi:flagellar basal body-associated protein FliL
MERNPQSGNIALIILGVLLTLGGIAAFVLVFGDQVNHAEEGTAKTIGGVGLGVGLLALVGGIMMRKNKG